jgi:hypothetical protein
VKASHSKFSFANLMEGDLSGLIGLLHGGVHVLIGMSIFGAILGFISYFIIHYFYEKQRIRRLNKFRDGQAIRKINTNVS